MAASSYDRALTLVLKHEGGWVDDPHDPGGATNLGVTIGTLSLWLGRPATKAEVKALTVAKVAPIYRQRFWDAIQGDALPAGLDYALFDFAVNSGPKRAVIGLQRALKIADDGALGPLTLAAVAKHKPVDLIDAVCDGRLSFLRALSTWPRYGKGWGRRVTEARATALAMAAAAPAIPVIVSTIVVAPPLSAPPHVDPAGPLTPMAPNAGRPSVPAEPIRGEITGASAGFVSWLKGLLGGKPA